MDFVIIPAHRFNDVIVHLRHTFFADEPLNKSVQLCRPGEGHVELEKHSMATLQDGYSVMAVTKDNRVSIYLLQSKNQIDTFNRAFLYRLLGSYWTEFYDPVISKALWLYWSTTKIFGSRKFSIFCILKTCNLTYSELILLTASLSFEFCQWITIFVVRDWLKSCLSAANALQSTTVLR